MGKFNKGILGGFSGTVGTVVGGKWKGMDIMRSKPSKHKGRQTAGQLAQQAKFAMMMKFVQPLSALFMTTFSDFDDEKTPFNSAFSYNLKNAVNGNYPNISINYGQVLVSRGGLLNAGNPTVTSATAGNIDFAWTNNAGMGNAKASDRLVAVAHCPALNSSTYIVAGPARSSNSFSMAAAGFSNHPVHTWFAFISDDGEEVSSSIYTGQVTVL